MKVKNFKLLTHFTGFIFLLNTISCTQLSFQSISQDYKKNDIFNATLMVMTLNNSIISQDLQDSIYKEENIIPKPITQQERSYFNNYMGPALNEYTPAKIFGIDPLFTADEIKFNYINFPLNSKHTLNMFVPESGTVSYYDLIPNFVLFFDNLSFKKSFGVQGGSLGSKGQKTFTMEIELNYCLWDNNNQQIASYGILTKTANLFNYPKKEHYISIFEELAAQIIQESPLVFRSM